MSKARRNRDTRIWTSLMGRPTEPPEPFSPTERAEMEWAFSRRPDRRIALGSPHQMTRKAHQFCGGGCGCLSNLEKIKGGPKHEGHAHGCGTHSEQACGGRRWANMFPLSTVAKNDHTMRISLGMKRAKRIKERGW